jgi:hypothetical protein
MAGLRNEINWKTIVRRIRLGKLTPIISNRVPGACVPDSETAVRLWADEIGYPLVDRRDLARVAQFARTTGHDALSPKEEYLELLKRCLLERARAEQTPNQSAFLDTLESELPELSFSQVAARLNYPHFEKELDNPLRKLAELPLPIYLTTSPDMSMEDALEAAGKQPRTEVCRWQLGLAEEWTSIFEEDVHYVPNVEEPLVFHIHGIDTDPTSLVLTEDDYLDFLVNISIDNDAIPERVGVALTHSSLLLLGYQLQDWDFRTIFRGLIINRRTRQPWLSLSIQLMPELEGVEDLRGLQDYLERYFEEANFDVYWGDIESFMQELWQHWEG